MPKHTKKKKSKKSLREMLRGRGRQIDDIVDQAVGRKKKKKTKKK